MEAFKVIEAKMVLKGYELIANVEWEKGGPRPDDACLSLSTRKAEKVA